ncbi:MAG: FIST N-terminal domain-containing protein [Desulfobacterales bacterium]
MKIGIGYKNISDARTSGRTVAEEAAKSGALHRPDLVLAFCSGGLAPAEFFEGLQSVFGRGVPIIGGSAIGIITQHTLCYTGHPAGAVAIQSDEIRCRTAAADRLNEDEQDAGRRLAQQLGHTPQDRLLLFFYDSIKQVATGQAPPVLNASAPLIEGIAEGATTDMPIFGAGLIGDYAMQSSAQFCGASVAPGMAAGLVMSGGLRVYHRIMHGCTPLDGVYHRVTKAAGACIYELDGQPVVPVIDDLYGDPDWRRKSPVDLLTIGIYHGGKYAGIEEGRYVNRLIVGALPEGEGICLFEPDIEEGTEIQFMLRDADKMITSARRNSNELLEGIRADGNEARLGFYIDCAGRTAGYSNTLTEEAAEVQEAFNRHGCPLFGFYSGVEVAPLLDKSRGLDWTGVLIVITKDKRDAG